MVKRTRKSVTWESAASKRLIHLAGGGCSVEEAVVTIVRDLLSDVEHPPTNLEALQAKLRIVGVEAQDIPFSGELRSGTDGFTVILLEANLNCGSAKIHDRARNGTCSLCVHRQRVTHDRAKKLKDSATMLGC